MARVLVALRLRLLAAQLDTPGRKVAATATAFVVGIAAAAGTFVAVLVGLAPDTAGVAVVAAAGLWIAWILVPLLAPLVGAGLDESLDPAALALLPVRGRDLVPGMLLGGFVGPGAWATSAAVLGLSGGHVRSAAGAPVALLVAILLAALCVASGRAAVTVVSRRAASRRRRDAAFAFLAVLLAAVVLGAAPLLLTGRGAVEDVAAVLRWTPGGQLGAALQDLRQDAVGAALAHVAAGAAFLAAILAAWALALDRALVRAGGEDAGSQARSAIAALAALLPVSDPRTAAVAAKELLMTARDPLRRSNWLVSWTVGIGGPLYFTLTASGDPAGPLALAAAVPAFIAAGGVQLNGLGLDGPALWTQISSSATLRADLRGRALALVVLNVPPILLAAVAFALVGGDLAWAPIGAAAGVGVLLAVVGAGAVLSVRAPMPRASSAMGVSPGMSARGVLGSAAGVVGALAGLAPGIACLVVGLRGWDPGAWLAAPVLVACGAGVCAFGLHRATAWADGHAPELLRAVTRGA
ncbi:hypothetical protein [Patulibacter sp. SYSU D01012]|uniref:hypothetical protein n=1 Tax=Patulibacter sp. SYSU D01012 TaxID=2817381 RepID=UPI001B310602|nr:hypothetical protein [Patulibacter sp. SYSU D01012]